MAEKKQTSKENEEKDEIYLKSCFVIMPISDAEGYEAGHFKRVYDHIIRPACVGVGFEPIRADDIRTTNHIIIDILKQIVEADMCICDLSGRNPNVLYELGIRQAFNLPVTLIKDERTPRIFDIQTLRDIPYDSSLRVDKIEQAIPEIASAMQNTYNDKLENINSIVQLLGIEAAKVTKTEVSNDTNLLLEAINNIGKRMFRIEDEFAEIIENRYAPFGNSLSQLSNKQISKLFRGDYTNLNTPSKRLFNGFRFKFSVGGDKPEQSSQLKKFLWNDLSLKVEINLTEIPDGYIVEVLLKETVELAYLSAIKKALTEKYVRKVSDFQDIAS